MTIFSVDVELPEICRVRLGVVAEGAFANENLSLLVLLKGEVLSSQIRHKHRLVDLVIT